MKRLGLPSGRFRRRTSTNALVSMFGNSVLTHTRRNSQHDSPSSKSHSERNDGNRPTFSNSLDNGSSDLSGEEIHNRNGQDSLKIGGHRKRIMVVDDEEDFTMVLKTVLEEEAFVVDSFNDAALALSGFKAGKYDLVITDIRMPTMSGFDLYRELKKVDHDVRVCFLTAFEVYESDFQKLFPKVKVEGFLRKPGSISYLTSKIKKITG